MVALAAAIATRPALAVDLDPGLFPVPQVLEPNVRFWVDVYSRYGVDQVVVHDDEHLGIVYDVLEMGDLKRSGISEGEQRRRRQERIDRTRDSIVGSLRRLAHAGPSNAEDERIWKLWEGVGSGADRFDAASRRVRAQSGLRERFGEGLVISGQFMSGIERVFAEERLPTVLGRLPFVESMFVHKAKSKVGAVGAWQFMPATARLYLQMNPAVDARFDTILAAEGAARMLRHDHEELRSWPLALTAYNHGRAGVARAAREVGSRDIGDIVRRYRSSRFGFASRNFYSEFVAAASVYARREELFPGVVPAAELRFDQFELPAYVSLHDLAQTTGIGVGTLAALNPALDGDVFAGTMLAPRSYRLRVPPGELPRFEAAFATLPPERRRDSQLQVGYRVRSGDTLGALARRFGTSVGAIQRANGLEHPNSIRVGQYLRIPGQSIEPFAPEPVLAAAIPAEEADAGAHTVRPGETLAAIGRRHGVSTDELVAANGLLSADRIYPGQRITVPGVAAPVAAPDAEPVEAARRHVVRSGDSLARIARRYSVSIEALLSRNELASSVIHPGQVLHIPD